MDNYPEHEKLAKVVDQSQAIGDFLEDMAVRGYVFARWNNFQNKLERSLLPVQELLAEHFGIDLKVLEDEKRAMLNELRAKQGD